jgi:hypothetical protein
MRGHVITVWQAVCASSATNVIRQNISHIIFSDFQSAQILINLKECTGMFLSLFRQK